MNFSFDYLISPITREHFFTEYFEKKHLHIKASNKNKFNHLFEEEDIDRILESQKLTLPNTRMAHLDGDLDAKKLALEGTNIIDVSKVVEKFSQGATLILSQLQDRKESLKLFCDELSKDFGQRFQTNIYCTPGNSSQGFSIHHDTHDVFIIQIYGNKSWKIYNSPIELAIKDQIFLPEKHIPGDAIDEFIMHPGDMLYIPRGLMHAAQTLDEKSIHITTGLMGYTWQDLLIDQINIKAQNLKALRTGFQPEYWNQSELYNEVLTEVQKIFEEDDFLATALDQLHQKSINRIPRRITSPIKLAEAIKNIKLSTILTFERGLHQIKQNKDTLSITLFNKEITLQLEYMPVLKFIEKQTSFNVSELPLLDDASKISFSQSLLEQGFLKLTQKKYLEVQIN